MLQSMRSQRVGHDLTTEQQQPVRNWALVQPSSDTLTLPMTGVSLWLLQMGRLMYSDWVTKPAIQDLIYAFSFDHTHLWENRVKEHKVKTDHFLYNLSVWTVLPSPDFPKSASQTSSLLALRKSLSHKIWRFAYPFKHKTYKWNIKHYSEVWGEFHLCLNNWVDYQVKAGKKT